jgi:NADH dehydrogenase
MRIAVTGAFSYSGKYITKRLLERGEEVITLTNHPNRDLFHGKVKAYPLDFDEPGMTRSLQGVEVLVNTYWVRFDKGENTQPRAVENTRKLVKAAKAAGVRRIVHISIANPSAESHLPYYWGKAANEKAVIESGLSYAILRPTVLVGMGEDILINNIAYLLRRLPFFFIPSSGTYGIQPIYIEDLADLAVEGVYSKENYIIDAVGPDSYAFKDLVKLIGKKVDAERPVISLPPRLALLAAQFLSVFVKDVMLTPEEVEGLMANLLVSKEPPRGKTAFKDWLEANKNTVGIKYASELKRHYA